MKASGEDTTLLRHSGTAASVGCRRSNAQPHSDRRLIMLLNYAPLLKLLTFSPHTLVNTHRMSEPTRDKMP